MLERFKESLEKVAIIQLPIKDPKAKVMGGMDKAIGWANKHPGMAAGGAGVGLFMALKQLFG